MARIKYVGELAVTAWRGVTFYQGLWTAPGALGDDDLATLAANPTFVVDLPNDGPLDAPPAPPPSPPPSPIVPTGVEPEGDGDEGPGDTDGSDGDTDGPDDDSAAAPPAPSLSI